MAANGRPSTSSSPPPPPGPSSSASGGDQYGRKRKREETDRPEDTKCSRVTSPDETVEDCPYRNLNRLVVRGQYQEALAYTKTNPDISSKAKLQRYLQKIMIYLITGRRLSRKELGLDYADVMMCLLSQRLQDYNLDDAVTYNEFFGAFLKPDYTEVLWKLTKKHTTNLQDKRRMLRILFLGAEYAIEEALQLIPDVPATNKPDDLQDCQKDFAHLVQILPANLHDGTDPAMSLSWLDDNSDSSGIGDQVAMFATAAELGLVQEAVLLYDAGAVNNAELMAVADKPGVQKMLSNEEDQSEMAVFLQKVLKQPRSLQSLAQLQVSRLVGQDVLGREDRVRQLPLASKLRDSLLLRHQLSIYRNKTKGNDQGAGGGV